MSKKLVMSDLKLTGISVLNSEFERNINVDFKTWEKEHDNYQFSVIPSLAGVKGNPNAARVILEAALFTPDYKENEEPFYLRVRTAFYFEDTAEYKDGEDVLMYYAPNMISMAFPYIRSYLQTVSSLSGISIVTVPAINVFELMKEMSKKNEKD
ncbi:hypothetical protein [Secundilactobacillus kimchicus]|uniref:hypothetical protein n=1 Tax=Secundilactobacillus kimchicus TaxID=528209 RepID=UPI0024A7F69B|nr:hypothetical protein [Secundilactobacillus kimchicus]